MPLIVEDHTLISRFGSVGGLVRLGGLYLYAEECEMEADYNLVLTNVGKLTVLREQGGLPIDLP